MICEDFFTVRSRSSLGASLSQGPLDVADRSSKAGHRSARTPRKWLVGRYFLKIAMHRFYRPDLHKAHMADYPLIFTGK